MKSPLLRCYVLDTGYCLAWEHHLIAGGQHCQLRCHSIAALIQHPQQGWLLWDTGYAPRMLDVTRHLPFSLYRRATPLYVDVRLSVVAQLQHWQLRPEDIRHIIISHFHADHIAGLRDFPEAEFIATQAGYDDIADRKGMAALKRAFIPQLLPDDFTQRMKLLADFENGVVDAPGPTYDLFGDGSLVLFPLPGHARGQMGLLAHTERGRILFAADGAWLRKAIYERRSPSRLTNLFIDDAREVGSTIERLYQFSQKHQDVIIIPSHCPEAFAQEVEQPHEDNK